MKFITVDNNNKPAVQYLVNFIESVLKNTSYFVNLSTIYVGNASNSKLDDILGEKKT